MPSFVSWFTGVGCFDLGLVRAGFERAGACEIDPFARKVYAARMGAPAFFPEDITRVEAKDIPDADLWVGGSPCQGFSVAGTRGGLLDDRSNLVVQWIRLLGQKRPRFALLENVPGLLSGKFPECGADLLDRDEMGHLPTERTWFGSVLGAVADVGYDATWRVLDGRHFGVAQRRRRIFVLLTRDPRDGPLAAEVLLESEGVRGGHPARGEARSRTAAGTRGGLAGLGEQRVARSLGSVGGGQDPAVGKGDLIVAATLTSGGHPNSNAPGRRAEDDVNLVAHTLQAADGHHGRRSPRGDGGDNLVVAATLNASYDRGAVGHNRDENLVPVAFDRAQITHPENRSRCAPGSPVPTLHAGGDAFVAFASNTRAEVRDLGDQAACLSSARGTNQTTYIAKVPPKESALTGGGADAPASGRVGDARGTSPTLDTATPPAVAFLDAWSTRGSSSPNQHPCKTDGLSDALDTTEPGAVSAPRPTAPDNNVTLRDGKRYVAPCGCSCGCWPDEVEGGDIHHGEDCPLPPKEGEDPYGLHESIAFHATQDPITSRDASPCLGTGDKHGSATTAVSAGPSVRRLTPMECELLQGLPPGWTCTCGVVPYSTAACKCKDGPRYRAIGNGGVVNVLEWIGRRVAAAFYGGASPA